MSRGVPRFQFRPVGMSFLTFDISIGEVLLFQFRPVGMSFLTLKPCKGAAALFQFRPVGMSFLTGNPNPGALRNVSVPTGRNVISDTS